MEKDIIWSFTRVIFFACFIMTMILLANYLQRPKL